LAYTPTNASYLNRIEAQFAALRYFASDGTDHASHAEQGLMIRCYLAWRNRHARANASAESSSGPTLPDRRSSAASAGDAAAPDRQHLRWARSVSRT
jgi:hypothetical protein